jgi:hypothetical protein
MAMDMDMDMAPQGLTLDETLTNMLISIRGKY